MASDVTSSSRSRVPLGSSKAETRHDGEGFLTGDEQRTIDKVYSSQPDLKDIPLENPHWELFTDGSSFMKYGKRMIGYEVTTQDKVIKAKALRADVSSQKAELIALTRALDLSKGKKISSFEKWATRFIPSPQWLEPAGIAGVSLNSSALLPAVALMAAAGAQTGPMVREG
ncbi:hypothetical protein DV515_00016021 [Chloebia gouldiae]|uniref:RNase H type-1 domain-containing protein n=1 Tax=Chloebia gouldiae TaxID=44316 RepID=A0A3L8RU60_CHLGU|nr:hypothetical protein DV515_00016021 [Chloebia gouldiae]